MSKNYVYQVDIRQLPPDQRDEVKKLLDGFSFLVLLHPRPLSYIVHSNNDAETFAQLLKHLGLPPECTWRDITGWDLRLL